jgi:anti-sigma factor RsiW
MSCEDARVLLDAYVDGELDLVHSLDLEKHLEQCSACVQIVENHQTLRKAMQSGSLYYETPSVGKLLPPPAKNPRRIYSMAALAASLLIAGFFVGRMQPGDNHMEQAILDSHLRSLMPGHLADVQSTDQHTVKPWFNGKLSFSPPVSDFAQKGFPLTGGRADSIGGREVAALVYQHRQHVINVYTWPSSGASGSTITNSVQQGYNLIHWTRSGFEWWLISDLNANELADFAAVLRAATP